MTMVGFSGYCVVPLLALLGGNPAAVRPAQDCDRQVEAAVTDRGGSTRLPGIAEVTWPTGALRGVRAQVAVLCSAGVDESFEETTAVFGKLERSRYAVRIAIARVPSRPFSIRVALTIPGEAGGTVVRVFQQKAEGGGAEEHVSFDPLATERQNGQATFTLNSGDMSASDLPGFTREALFVLAWSRPH